MKPAHSIQYRSVHCGGRPESPFTRTKNAVSDPASGVEPYPLGGAQMAGQTPQSGAGVFRLYGGAKGGSDHAIWGSTTQSDHRVNTVNICPLNEIDDQIWEGNLFPNSTLWKHDPSKGIDRTKWWIHISHITLQYVDHIYRRKMYTHTQCQPCYSVFTMKAYTTIEGTWHVQTM